MFRFSSFSISYFYVAMLLENTTLLVAASDFLSEKSWDSMTLPIAVLSSFLLGATSLVLYYRFLHPKSTEIAQGHGLSHRNHHHGLTCLEGPEQGESSYSPGGGGGDKSPPRAQPPPCTITAASPSLAWPAPSWSILGVAVPGWVIVPLPPPPLAPDSLGTKNERRRKDQNPGGMAPAAWWPSWTRTSNCCNSEATGDEAGPGTPLGLKEGFQSASDEPTSAETPDEEESEDSLEDMQSPLGVPGVGLLKASSPEGKSVFGTAPSPTSAPVPPVQLHTVLQRRPPVPQQHQQPPPGPGQPPHGHGRPQLHPQRPRPAQGRQGTADGSDGTSLPPPQPKLDYGTQGLTAQHPSSEWARRQLILSHEDEDDDFRNKGGKKRWGGKRLIMLPLH
ncbi:hypothetical protein J4Q44_G00317430 [Coregonus suidteri]|uniref:XK-related protein n=1 Tax=Coregonus suidteri TaxID=861788 RepID=A0AAN8L3W7_9TELE